MDALPGVGHACGHNLIGMSGVAIACALKAAMEKHNISGKIILLGTPGTILLRLNNSGFNSHAIVKLRREDLAK
jgi:hypothetical protein